MDSERGQTRLNGIVLSLVLACAVAAVLVVMVARSAGNTVVVGHPGTDIAAAADDLVIDFTGRSGPQDLAWRVEGKTDSVLHTARGLLIVAASADDPPRLVLDLGVPDESLALL